MKQRIIHSNNQEISMVGKLPLIIATSEGIVGEADSIRGLITLLIPVYVDAEDEIDEWNYRVEYARKKAMFSLAEGINIAIMDRNKGLIKNNYAAAEDDEDYEEDDEDTVVQYIYVETEKAFLMSLKDLRLISILRREDVILGCNDCNKCAHNNSNKCGVYNTDIVHVFTECNSEISIIEEKENQNYLFL